MSKASEYAATQKAAKDAEMPKHKSGVGTGHARADGEGDLHVNGWFSPLEALKLAEWIKETFGETV